MRVCISRSAFRYLVPRKRLRGVALLVRGVALLALFLAIVGAVVFMKETVILYIWNNQSTQQLEAMIPQEVNMKRPAMITTRSSAALVSERHNTQCKVTNPQVLLFIRMPKCASTSFMSMFRSLATPLSFQLHFNPSGAYDWNYSTIKKEAQLIKSKSLKGKLLYARHFYFANFELHGLTNYTYLTVIRKPTSRFVSSYLYYHYSSKPYIQKMLKPKYKNESLLECISRGLNGCAHNWLTKYFCGHQSVCKSGNGTAIAIAKTNMKQHFAAVGLLEDMDLTLKVFAKVVPGYFALHNKNLPESNKNEQSMHLSPEEDQAVQRANAADLELYAYAKELLHAMVTSCHIQ